MSGEIKTITSLMPLTEFLLGDKDQKKFEEEKSTEESSTQIYNDTQALKKAEADMLANMLEVTSPIPIEAKRKNSKTDEEESVNSIDYERFEGCCNIRSYKDFDGSTTYYIPAGTEYRTEVDWRTYGSQEGTTNYITPYPDYGSFPSHIPIRPYIPIPNYEESVGAVWNGPTQPQEPKICATCTQPAMEDSPLCADCRTRAEEESNSITPTPSEKPAEDLSSWSQKPLGTVGESWRKTK